MRSIFFIILSTMIGFSAHSMKFIKDKNGVVKFLPSTQNSFKALSVKTKVNKNKYKITADVMYLKLTDDVEQFPTSICTIQGEISYVDLDKDINSDSEILTCNGVLNNKNVTVELQPSVAHYKNGKKVIQSFYHYLLVKDSETQAIIGSRDSQSQSDLVSGSPIGVMDKSSLINLNDDETEFVMSVINFKKNK